MIVTHYSWEKIIETSSETDKCLKKDQKKMVDKNEQTADIENQQKLYKQKHAKCSHPPINFKERNQFKKRRFGLKRAPQRYAGGSFVFESNKYMLFSRETIRSTLKINVKSKCTTRFTRLEEDEQL